jgi:hypothetical protein
VKLAALLSVLAGLLSTPAPPEPSVHSSTSYRVDDRVDEDVFVFDSRMGRTRLLDLIEADTRVLVLFLIGGGLVRAPSDDFRGPLWCRDSFDDLAVQRAMVRQFDGDPSVRFIAVAIPPALSSDRYGYAEGVFLGTPEPPDTHGDAVDLFIEATERARALLPFDAVYYDPWMYLLGRAGEFAEDNRPSWEGRFKWHRDPRRYGVPTIWILGADGVVLREPFWGNEYDAVPPRIHYGFAELRDALDAALEGKPR